MSDYAQALGRIAECFIEATAASFAEAVQLVRPHAATPEIRERLDGMVEQAARQETARPAKPRRARPADEKESPAP